MEIILNASLAIGGFMFLLLLFKRQKKREDFFFLTWIAVVWLQIYFYQTTLFRFPLTGFWGIVGFGLPLLSAPILFLYIFVLTGHKLTGKVLFAHLSIYFFYVFMVYFAVQHYHIELVALDGYLQLPSTAPDFMQYYAVPLALSGLVYFIWDVSLLRQHRKHIGAIFSFDEKIDLKWVDYIIYSYLGLFVIASFLIFGAIHFQLMPLENAFALVGILLSTMLVAFGSYAFRQTSIFSNINADSLPSERKKADKASYVKSGLTQSIVHIYAQKLEELMETEKPFLNENLTLNSLAIQCGLGQTQLSQTINQYFQMNFYDFVNKYRIMEAQKKLVSADCDHLSVLGIAYECGFKSKSSFNRYFKKYTGTSPSEFKRNSRK